LSFNHGSAEIPDGPRNDAACAAKKSSTVKISSRASSFARSSPTPQTKSRHGERRNFVFRRRHRRTIQTGHRRFNGKGDASFAVKFAREAVSRYNFRAVSQPKTVHRRAAAPAAARERDEQLAAAAAVRDQSRLLTSIIGVFVVGYLVLSFWLFFYALKFIAKFPASARADGTVLFVLFAFLSAAAVEQSRHRYTNLFRNRETAFLMTLPVSTQAIFNWKFIESTLLASWAFILIAPLLGRSPGARARGIFIW